MSTTQTIAQTRGYGLIGLERFCENQINVLAPKAWCATVSNIMGRNT
jgi:hypothetical protein